MNNLLCGERADRRIGAQDEQLSVAVSGVQIIQSGVSGSVRVRAGEPAELALIAHGTSAAVRRAATARTTRNPDEGPRVRGGCPRLGHQFGAKPPTTRPAGAARAIHRT